MTHRFDAGREAWALALAGSLPLGAALLAAAAVVGCPGPEPKEAAAGGGGATSSGRDASGATGGTTMTGGGGDTRMSTGMGVGGTDGGMGGGSCMPGSPNVRDCNGQCIDVLGSDMGNCGACGRTCGTQNVAMDVPTLCQLGVCKPKCAAGFIDLKSPQAPADDDGCETQARRVFVTSMPVPSVFGGVNKTADETCASLGATPVANVTWKAWLSSSATNSPSVTFDANYQGVYVLMGTKIVVARTWVGLTTMPLENGITRDEAGLAMPSGLEVWTGTKPDGTATSANCTSWITSDPTNTATIGLTGATDQTWTQNHPAPCSIPRRLYCFEE